MDLRGQGTGLGFHPYCGRTNQPKDIIKKDSTPMLYKKSGPFLVGNRKGFMENTGGFAHRTILHCKGSSCGKMILCLCFQQLSTPTPGKMHKRNYSHLTCKEPFRASLTSRFMGHLLLGHMGHNDSHPEHQHLV